MWMINFVVSAFKNATSRCSDSRNESSRLLEERSSGDPGAHNPSSSGRQLIPELSFSQGYQTFEHSKKALRLCLYHLVFYFLLATSAYSYVFEKWPVVDSLFFATVTFTTVGYGDITPSTDSGRLFTCCFALYGIGILSTLIGIISQAVLEMGHDEMEKIKHRHTKRIMGMFSTSDKDGSVEEEGEPEKTLCREYFEVAVLEAPLVALVLIVTILLGLPEGRSIISSIYFSVISATTIGYGDFYPTSTIRKLYAIFFLPFQVAVFGEVLSRIAGVYMARKARETEQAFLRRDLTLRDLQVMDVDKDNKVTYGEFLSFMLVALEKVEKSQVDEIRTIFESLDIDSNGFLEKNDLVKRVSVSMSQTTSPFLAGVSV
jgi:potassium channel subfamily K